MRRLSAVVGEGINPKVAGPTLFDVVDGVVALRRATA
jgi:hypothetical protein